MAGKKKKNNRIKLILVRMNIILLGAPGSGKGIEGRKLSEKYKLLYFSTGDYFREKAKEQNELGRTIKNYIDNGKFVPDNITLEILEKDLPKGKGIILDGFPRNLSQAEALEKEKFRINHVVLLDVPEEVLIHRIQTRMICEKCGDVYNTETRIPKITGRCDKCGGRVVLREDDKDIEKMKYRLKNYREVTEPLIGFYRKRGLLREINGVGSIQEIFERICKVLDR